MQRIFLAIILGMNMGLAVTQPQIAFLIQLAVIVLLLVGGFTGKCLSLQILRQVLPPCDAAEKKEQR
jgi:Na+/phosphate symporter